MLQLCATLSCPDVLSTYYHGVLPAWARIGAALLLAAPMLSH